MVLFKKILTDPLSCQVDDWAENPSYRESAFSLKLRVFALDQVIRVQGLIQCEEGLNERDVVNPVTDFVSYL